MPREINMSLLPPRHHLSFTCQLPVIMGDLERVSSTEVNVWRHKQNAMKVIPLAAKRLTGTKREMKEMEQSGGGAVAATRQISSGAVHRPGKTNAGAVCGFGWVKSMADQLRRLRDKFCHNLCSSAGLGPGLKASTAQTVNPIRSQDVDTPSTTCSC